MLSDERDDEIHHSADGRRLAQIAMDEKPDVPGEEWNVFPNPHEVRVGVSQKAGQPGDAGSRPRSNEMPADVVQLARDRPCASNAEQPFLLRHVPKALAVSDELPSIRHIAMCIVAARVETEGHDPQFSREAAGLLGPHQPESHIRFPAAERYLLRLRGERKTNIRIKRSEMREMLRQQMRGEHGWSAERDLSNERRMRSPGDPGNAVRRAFHRDGLIEDLLSDRRQSTGSWQAIDQRHIQFGFERRQPTAHRGVVHLQGARRARQGAAARHRQEMTKIFPIDHLCGFSRFAGIYTEFLHRNHRRNFEASCLCKVVSMSVSYPLRSRITLAAASLGFVVVLLDVSVVNVALDALRTSFSTDVAGLQWVVNAYTLIFAALLLMAGALGDRFGARAIFITGFVLFTLASLACGLAPTLATLVAARLTQGVGAALLVPNSLSLLSQAFPDKEQRSRAVGWWGAAGGIALAAGPVVGGFLVAHFGWRSVFLINIPVGLVGLALILRYSASSPRNEGRSLDLPGQAAAIIALASLATALTDAAHLGWTHPRILVTLIIAILAATGFLLIEARSRAPMLPLAFFSSSAFSIASITGVLVNFAYYGLIFVFSLFFQLEQHLSPQETGIAFLPMTIVLMVMNIVAGRLITGLGARRLMVFGLLLAATGYLLLIPVSVGGSYWQLVVPMLMAASGIALMVPTMTNVTLSSVDPSRAGIASGVLNTARQVGGMLGVATCGYFVRDTAAPAFMHGMHLSLIVAVVLLFLGAALSYFCLNREV